jgi:hypothetical protein
MTDLLFTADLNMRDESVRPADKCTCDHVFVVQASHLASIITKSDVYASCDRLIIDAVRGNMWISLHKPLKGGENIWATRKQLFL